MNVYIVRHAEPDYARDTLTEKGWREAELLSRRLVLLYLSAGPGTGYRLADAAKGWGPGPGLPVAAGI